MKTPPPKGRRFRLQLRFSVDGDRHRRARDEALAIADPVGELVCAPKVGEGGVIEAAVGALVNVAVARVGEARGEQEPVIGRIIRQNRNGYDAVRI